MKTTFNSIRLTLGLLLAALISSSAAEDPVKAPVTAKSLISLIEMSQKGNVRRSYGTSTGACFTADNLATFQKRKVPENIVAGLQKSENFALMVENIRTLDTEARKELITKARKTYSPTWAQLGRISPDGQTNAGQAAERAIAAAITDLVEARLKPAQSTSQH